MRFGVLGVSVALAWFLVICTGATIAVSLAAAILSRRRSMDGRPGVWLALRLLPAVAAGTFLLVASGPAYLRFEPRHAEEAIEAPLIAAAAAALLLLAAAVTRTWRAARRIARLEAGWLARATRLADPSTAISVFVVDGPAPGATLIGVFRPRLYLSRRVLDALTAEELCAVMAHETAHQRRLDNLARWMLLAAPDPFGATTLGRDAAVRWAAGAEAVADDEASGADPARAVALASAIVKTARLQTGALQNALPVSALCEGGAVADRVSRLLDDERRRLGPARVHVATVAVGVVGAGVVIAIGSLLLHRPIHDVTEWLVRLAW